MNSCEYICKIKEGKAQVLQRGVYEELRVDSAGCECIHVTTTRN